MIALQGNDGAAKPGHVAGYGIHITRVETTYFDVGDLK